jgi:hypothetical protein
VVDTGLAQIREMQEAIEAMDSGPKKTPKKKSDKKENTVH